MSNTKFVQEERKDLEKYTRFLIYKSLQIIVQARLGEKIKTKSKPYPSTGADWFNLAIQDIPDVHSATKKALIGQSSLLGQNVCVEISLKTAEGSSMVLETWYIGLNKEQCDPNVRVSFTVYNRMGIMLKSLFSVSRVTPAYKLSRRQGCSDDYVIFYRFYVGEPQFFMLGDGYQTMKVGVVPTPRGTIYTNVAYRTKLQITPQRSSREIKFEVKDDHFRKDSPKRPTTPKPCALGYRRESVSDLEQDGIDGQDLCSTTFTNSPGDPYLNGVVQNGQIQHSQPIKISPRSGNQQQGPEAIESVEKHPSFTSLQKVGAFAQHRVSKDLKNDFDDVPFLSLLQQNGNTDVSEGKNVGPESNKASGQKSSSSGENMDVTSSTDSISSNASAPEDFVMVELKTPFAGSDPKTDLNKFYRECQGAPQLNMFGEEHPDVSQTLEQITNQLEMFESNMKDFDEFVTSLTESSHE